MGGRIPNRNRQNAPTSTTIACRSLWRRIGQGFGLGAGAPPAGAAAVGAPPPFKVSRNETRSRYSLAVSAWPNVFGITFAGNPETTPLDAGSRTFPMMYSGVWVPA